MTMHDITGLDPELKRLWDAIIHERELRLEHMAATETALRLQAAKNDEKFRDHNHALARAERAQELTVPRETFEIWRAGVDKQLAEYRGALNASLLLGGVVLTVVNIAIGMVLRYWSPVQ